MENKKKMRDDYVPDRVSVIILSFNSEKYINDAIQSVFMQDYPDIEVIVADDGSAAFDKDKLEIYIRNHSGENIKSVNVIHHDKNLGTVRNINYALCTATGEYIKILGGDDTYPAPDVFSRQVKDIKENRTFASIGMLQQCDPEMKPIYDKRFDESNKSQNLVLNMDYVTALKYISKHDIFPIANQSVCYHRSFFIETGLCDEDFILIEDSELGKRLLKYSHRVSRLEYFTVNHRAKVGISSSKELFCPKRILYYKDCVTSSKKSLEEMKNTSGCINRIERLRVNEFVYNMALSKCDGKGTMKRIGICITYIDAIVYYSFTNTKKLIKRLKYRFSKN